MTIRFTFRAIDRLLCQPCRLAVVLDRRKARLFNGPAMVLIKRSVAAFEGSCRTDGSNEVGDDDDDDASGDSSDVAVAGSGST